MQCSYLDCEYDRPVVSKEDAILCAQCYETVYCTPDCRALDWVSHRKNLCNKRAETTQINLQSSTSDISMLSQTSSVTQKKKKTLNDFEIIDQNNATKPDLGRGTYSNVKLVKEKANPRKSYAMKILNKKQLKNTIKTEIKIQKKLNHPHIIKLCDYFEDKENVYLILEYAQKGALGSYLKKKKKLPENEAFVFFFQTCIAIDYLHKKGVVHRDLKPDNMLLTDRGDIKLSDFGMSVEDVGEKNNFCGTVDYMAPEIIQKQNHDFRVDVWSLGVLLFEMLHGFPPFSAKTTEETYEKIIKKDLSFGEISDNAKKLINSLLGLNPNDRASLSSIFVDPWMQKYAKEFNIDYTKYVYKPKKSQSLLENSNSYSSDIKAVHDSSSQNLQDPQISLTSELTNSQKPASDPSTINSNTPLSNQAQPTPNFHETQVVSRVQVTDDLQDLPKSTEKISKHSDYINQPNLFRKTSPGYLTDSPSNFEMNTHASRKSLHTREVNNGTERTSFGKPVDVEKYIQQYEIAETDEMKILNKLDNFYSTGVHKHQNENKPLDTKDPNRLGTLFSNQNEDNKSRHSRQTKEKNLEMSFQDRFGVSVEEENIGSRVEETFGDFKVDRESEASLRKTNSIDENQQKIEKAENNIKTSKNNFPLNSDTGKNYRSTTNEKVIQERFLQKNPEHTRYSSFQGTSSNPVYRDGENLIPKKQFLTLEQKSSNILAKSPKKENEMDFEDDLEDRIDFERKSTALLRNFKHKLNNVYHINSSPTANYEESERASASGGYKETVLYPNIAGNQKQIEEKLTQTEMSPQRRVEKKRLIENPELTKDWLNRKTADKDLDYSFMPKSLIYNYKTMDQSMAELRKKTQELEAIIGDKDPERVSRASWKNIQDDSIYEKSIQKNQNNGGLFSKFLSMLGCVERDSQGRLTSTMQQPKNKK